MTSIVSCYDNGGLSLDRYKIFFNTVADYNGNLTCLSLSYFPTTLYGLSKFTCGQLGPHNGKKIPFDDLPAHIQDHIRLKLPEVRPMLFREPIAA